MSVLLAGVAQAVATPVPSPEVIDRTVTVFTQTHLFQLAEVVKYVGLGVGLSVIHGVINGRFGLPKALNKVLPVLYAALAGLAVVVVSGTVDWTDWYQIFVQVATGAAGVYALITAYNTAAVPNPQVVTKTTLIEKSVDLPSTTNP